MGIDFGYGPSTERENPSMSRAEAPSTLEGDAGAAPRPVLRTYQEEAVAFLLERSRAIEADAPGIGKTATVISSLSRRDPQPSPVLVLAPLSVVRHWEAEIGRWSGYSAFVGVGSAAQRREAREALTGCLDEVDEKGRLGDSGLTEDGYRVPPLVYITNYEAAKADAADLFDIGWKAVVCDEAHRLRNRKTKNFKTIRSLVLTSPIFIAITGTPVVNDADDLWALMHLVNSKVYSSYWAFVDNFCESEQTTFNGKLAYPIKQVKGLRPGMDGVLRQQLRDMMIRRSLNELLPELPEVVETVYEVDLSKDERKAYDQLKQRFFTDIGDEKVIAPNEVAKITRLRQLSTDWSVLGGQDAATKVKRLYELLEDIGNEQVVIFSAFSKVIDPIAAQLGAGKITGDVKPNDRADVIRAFKEGNLQYVCGTIKAMGEGIDLQSARHAVFLDLEWTPSAHEQCIARIHRYGQRADAVFVHIIAARDTVDAYVAKTISSKQAIIDSVVGLSWSDVVTGRSIHGV